MSWLYSQALVAEFLGATCSGGAQFAQLKSSPMPQAFLQPDKMTAFSRLSRSGMTFAPLTESLGGELLMSYLEGFRARTSPLLDKGQESQGKSLPCGAKWQESLGKSAHNGSSSKTPQCLPAGDWKKSYKTFPKWGTMQNGAVCQQPPKEQTTKGKESGLWLPTPTAHNAKEAAYPAEYTRVTPTLATHVGGKIHPHFTEWMMGWPTGWTDLKPLETDKFQQWRQKHSDFWQENEK